MRASTWQLAGAQERLTIDLDATLIGSHSEKEGAAGNFKGGYGFHPMLAYGDQTGEALGGELRPGNAGANTAADQIAVAEHAIAQIPAEHIEQIELLLRSAMTSPRRSAPRSCKSPSTLGSRRSTSTAASGPTGRSQRSPNSWTSPPGRLGRGSSSAASARTPARN